ncbi:helix-hairpin-helix domain-containing protein [Clostridium sp. HCP1S3_B4]|uniref:helix-hairpin-helix domain-containing protein n=1 Tax=unclassified Clostridium TaxID=2614128 RepID=UPI002A7916DE|nr:helix-hairpin-helix domain-containing protein [Clostridium sp.]
MIINKKYKVIGSVILAIIIIVVMFVKYSLGGRNDLKSSSEDIFIDDEIKDKSYDLPSNVSNDSNSLSQSISNFKEIVVEIKGEVKNPNIYKLNENSIIEDLINKAGGLTEFADISKINRAEKLQDHIAIVIPNKNDPNSQNTISSSVSASSTQGNSLVNLNTATDIELQSLPGVGPSKAKSIIEYREKNGGFKSIDEIKNIKGIGESSFEKLKDKITI